MDVWLQIAVQVPLVAAFIYFVLQRDKHESEERLCREKRDSEERIQRDQQWRQFMMQRDEQWNGVLISIQNSQSISNAATLKQLEAIELELKASSLKFESVIKSNEAISDKIDNLETVPLRSRK